MTAPRVVTVGWEALSGQDPLEAISLGIMLMRLVLVLDRVLQRLASQPSATVLTSHMRMQDWDSGAWQ